MRCRSCHIAETVQTNRSISDWIWCDNVWGRKKKTLASLETFQNSFLRIDWVVMKTSPIPALQVEASIPPLWIRRKELTLRYYSTIKQFPEHTSYPAIHTLPWLHHDYIDPCERRTGLTIASRQCHLLLPETRHCHTRNPSDTYTSSSALAALSGEGVLCVPKEKDWYLKTRNSTVFGNLPSPAPWLSVCYERAR